MPTGYVDSTRVGDANASSLTLPFTTSPASDQFALVWVHREDATEPSLLVGGVDAGFRLLANAINPNNSAWYYVYGKRLTGSESGNLTVDFGGVVNWCEAEMVTMGGLTSSNWNPVESVQIAAASAGISFPSVSGVTVDADPALVWFGDTLSPDADTPPTGFTEVEDNSRLTSAAYRLPGTSGTYTSSGSTHATSSDHAACMVVLSNTGGGPVARAGIGRAPAGTTAPGTGTTTVTADKPLMQDGQMVVMHVGVKPDTLTVDTPTGWTLAATVAGGGGTTGTDAGPMRGYTFTRKKDNTWSTMPAMPIVGGTTTSSAWAHATAYANETGVWDVAAATGSDSTTGAAWSAALGSNPGLAAGDYVSVASVIPTDVSTPNQFTAEAVTATGATFQSAVELCEPDTTQGNDSGGFIFDTRVMSGTATANPTVTATASGTTTNVRGVSMLVRLRSVAGGGGTPGQGTAAGSFTFTGAATGTRVAKGTAGGTVTFTGAAVGKRTPKATTAGTFTFSGTAQGVTVRRGTAGGTVTFTGTATGKRTPKASAGGAYTYTGSTVGKRTPKATGSGGFAYTGTAVGNAPTPGVSEGSATGSWSFAGSAVGKRAPTAGGGGSYAYTGTATGAAPEVATRTGTATGAWSFAGTAVGTAPTVEQSTGTAVGTYAYAGTAVGQAAIVVVDTPPERTLVVGLVSRTLYVTTTTTLAVPAESRTLHVPAESRTIGATP